MFLFRSRVRKRKGHNQWGFKLTTVSIKKTPSWLVLQFLAHAADWNNFLEENYRFFNVLYFSFSWCTIQFLSLSTWSNTISLQVCFFAYSTYCIFCVMSLSLLQSTITLAEQTEAYKLATICTSAKNIAYCCQMYFVQLAHLWLYSFTL
jgi:hypothetical protein